MNTMVIKFNPSALPSAEVIAQINLREITLSPTLSGWCVTDMKGNDVVVAADDYFIIYDTVNFAIILRTVYNANAQAKRIVVQEIATELVEAIVDQFIALGLTDTVNLDILKTIDVVFIAIHANKIQAARNLANATATTANFTAGRKTGLLNLIDAAVLKL